MRIRLLLVEILTLATTGVVVVVVVFSRAALIAFLCCSGSKSGLAWALVITTSRLFSSSVSCCLTVTRGLGVALVFAVGAGGGGGRGGVVGVAVTGVAACA